MQTSPFVLKKYRELVHPETILGLPGKFLFVTHAGVSAARRAELEKGMMKAMDHSMYQAYLKNSGLDSTSPQPSGPWGEQIKSMVAEFGPALKEMGLIN